MDFNSVLSLAHSNCQQKNEVSKGGGYNPLGSGAKTSRNSTVDSVALKAFMEKKKRLEQTKAVEADKRRRELLDLRAAAKNNRKATAMAKRTKDNNFMTTYSITEHLAREAAKNQNRDLIKKPSSSFERSHKKPPQKPEPKPADKAPKLADKAPKPAVPPSPSINYNQLLNLAATKKNDLLELPRIPKKKGVVDADIQGRLMTNDEKRRFLEEQARKQGRSVTSITLPPKSGRGPRYRGEEEKNVVVESLKVIQKPPSAPLPAPPPPAKRPLNNKTVPKSSTQPSASVNHGKISSVGDKKLVPKAQTVAGAQGKRGSQIRTEPLKQSQIKSNGSAKNVQEKLPVKKPLTSSNGAVNRPSKTGNQVVTKKPVGVLPSAKSSAPTNRPVNSNISAGRAPVSTMQKPVNRAAQQGSTPAVRSEVMGRPPNVPPPGMSRRPSDIPQRRPPPPAFMMQQRRPPPPSMRLPMKRRIESDDEYDEEMEDFIDDGPMEEGFDYSAQIKEIFGYDKSRYRDDDDDIVESNFAQQMREESISTRMGMLEDLEDIQREQEELARAKKRKKLKK